ncbi:MAG: serine dehydratase [Bacteroidetes bacterium HGW-Bacteroidetes-6]|jgi:threonine dehydratase|nr:MAG: serine dehydratase [Bacteroidetes bacterium HGW-Bacteroidetes-6]
MIHPIFTNKENFIGAKQRIIGYTHKTPIVTCESINRLAGCEIFFKLENLQKAGAFKSRGASNAVFTLLENGFKGDVATHSSGNHAQALSRVARFAGIEARVVMPENSVKSKIDAAREYGADITFCIPTLEARETTLAQVIEKTGAREIHPYDNVDIILGQSTCTMEILEEIEPDIIVAPVGGGGLLSGTALAAVHFGKSVRVFAAEPEGASDAWQSFQKKQFVPSERPNTIADGLLTSLGKLTFPVLIEHVSDVFLASETQIIEAMRTMWQRAKILAEPSSAVPLAVVLRNHAIFAGKKVAIVVSGGNIDIDNLPWK